MQHAERRCGMDVVEEFFWEGRRVLSVHGQARGMTLN